MLNDITERLEERADSYEQSGPSAHHTAALLREAKIEIEALRKTIAESPHQSELVKHIANDPVLRDQFSMAQFRNRNLAAE